VTQTSADDWLDAGLVLLRDRGHDALTIDALCRALGRTKGSFYHHFPDVSVFHDALLRHWEKRSTADLIALADDDAGGDARPSPAERRARLHALVRSHASGVERAVQAWALRAPVAKRVRARVDARRIAYLADLRRSAGVAPAAAERLAQIEYAAFLGGMLVFDLPSADGWKAFEKANALLLRALEAVERAR